MLRAQRRALAAPSLPYPRPSGHLIARCESGAKDRVAPRLSISLQAEIGAAHFSYRNYHSRWLSPLLDTRVEISHRFPFTWMRVILSGAVSMDKHRERSIFLFLFFSLQGTMIFSIQGLMIFNLLKYIVIVAVFGVIVDIARYMLRSSYWALFIGIMLIVTTVIIILAQPTQLAKWTLQSDLVLQFFSVFTTRQSAFLDAIALRNGRAFVAAMILILFMVQAGIFLVFTNENTKYLNRLYEKDPPRGPTPGPGWWRSILPVLIIFLPPVLGIGSMVFLKTPNNTDIISFANAHVRVLIGIEFFILGVWSSLLSAVLSWYALSGLRRWVKRGCFSDCQNIDERG